jgi:DNA (cytosine-5)-methyltransferase 1
MKSQGRTRGFQVVGLFAGVGGLEVGLSRAGHDATLLCEIDPGAKSVLHKRFPGVRVHDDVTTLTRLPRATQLIAAGFPCQDLSQAGRTKGMAGSQSSLVGHVFRLLRSHDVPWVLLENVPFMLQLGKGAAMRYVADELEDIGYRWAYRVIDARAFGIPQRRERVYLLASKVADPARILFAGNETPREPLAGRGTACGFYWTEGLRGLGWAVDAVPTLKGGSTVGIPSPPGIWMPDGSFVKPDIRDAERLQGLEPDWTRPAEETCRTGHRWKLVGNAISVPVAKWLGNRLLSDPGDRPAFAATFDPGSTWPRAAFKADGPRLAVKASTWPVRLSAPPLREFLRYPTKPLSEKALAGFYSRLSRSSLNRPANFDRDLRRVLGLSPQASESGSRRLSRAHAVASVRGSVNLFED